MSKCEDIIDAILDKDKTIKDVLKPKKKKSKVDPAAEQQLEKDKKEPNFLKKLGKMAKDAAEDKIEEAVDRVKAFVKEQVDKVIDQIDSVLDSVDRIRKAAKKLTKKSTYKRLGKAAKEKLRTTAKATICHNSVVTTVSNTVNSVNVAVTNIKNYTGKKKKSLRVKDPQKQQQVNEQLQKDIQNDVQKNLAAANAQADKQNNTQPVSLVDTAIDQSALGTTGKGTMFDFGTGDDNYRSSYTGSWTTCQEEMQIFLTNYQQFDKIRNEIQTKFPGTSSLDAFQFKYNSFEKRHSAGKVLWKLNAQAILHLNKMNHSLYDVFKNCDAAEYLYNPMMPNITGYIIDYFPNKEFPSDETQVAPTVTLDIAAPYVVDTKDDPFWPGDLDLTSMLQLYIDQHGKSILRTDLYPCLLSQRENCYGEYWSKYYTYVDEGFDEGWKRNSHIEMVRDFDVISRNVVFSPDWPEIHFNGTTGVFEPFQPEEQDAFNIIYKFYEGDTYQGSSSVGDWHEDMIDAGIYNDLDNN
jgi:hypothetical protein